MTLGFVAPSAVLVSAIPVSAGVYSCQSKVLCVCESENGCSGLDDYLPHGKLEKCTYDEVNFQEAAKRRKVILNGETQKLKLKEIRPYFREFDWYQNSVTRERGLTHLNFETKNAQIPFEVRQMVKGSVIEYKWRMPGTCEDVE